MALNRIMAMTLLGMAALTGAYAQPVNIDNGRQLFVDDYLIGSSSGLQRVWHYPEKYEGNPVLVPQTPWERPEGGNPVAVPKGGGIWWDEQDGLFKMWYEGGWLHSVCYATSRDGIHWERPVLDVVEGTNIVLPLDNPVLRPDSWSVVLDPDAKDPSERWKMMLHRPVIAPESAVEGACLVSGDGIHWRTVSPLPHCGDRSSLFYDPFREKWVFSLRSSMPAGENRHGHRNRMYYELEDFMDGPQWLAYSRPLARELDVDEIGVEPWLWADDDDIPDPEINALAGLYCFDAVAYESIMLGMFEIHLGPDNSECMKLGLPKITDLKFGYSRDGKNFIRPDRTPAIRSERWASDKWDKGYVQAVSNLCVVQGDELWFYYGAFAGDTTKVGPGYTWEKANEGMYSNACTGIAKLRRDGFASMDGSGELLTRPLFFSGDRLFVNVDASRGAVSAEILDASGNVPEGYDAASSRISRVNSTKCRIKWKKHDVIDLPPDGSYRIRFILENASLYSFWISLGDNGESNGYLAGGGPGYPSLKDAPSFERKRRKPVIAGIDAAHSLASRKYQGNASLAVSPGGIMWAVWACLTAGGGTDADYFVLSSSSDGGRNWKEVKYFDPDGEGPRHIYSPGIWMAPDGNMHITWTDRSGTLNSLSGGDQLWEVPMNPETGKFLSSPRVIADGVMSGNPVFDVDGSWLLPVARWKGNPSACVYASTDGGKTFCFRGGARLPVDRRSCDDHSIVLKSDGTLKAYIRGREVEPGDNCLWEAESSDGGFTWTAPIPCRASSRDAGTSVSRLSSGSLLMTKHSTYSLLVRHPGNLTAFVSEDDGRSWWGGLCIDTRPESNCPSIVQMPDKKIAVISDCDNEISFVLLSEDDVLKSSPSPERRVISRL